MSPYTLVSPTEEEELSKASSRTAALEEPRPSVVTPRAPQAPRPIVAPLGRSWFNEAMLEMSTTRPPKRTWDFIAAFAFEGFVIGLFILLPLIYTQAIDISQFSSTYLVAPPPPPPPPPPPAQGLVRASTAPRRVFTQGGKLFAPTVVPTQITMLKEEALPPDVVAGVEGGVPGGVPGGQVGGVLGGILQENIKNYHPVAPSTVGTRAKPLRIGGNVKPPRAIGSPAPLYPVLARQAKIQGQVQINAIIDAQGNVVEMKVVSGHALLIQAAMEAVSRWKYEPTILNGEPVAVELIVTVNFSLDAK